MNKKMIITNLLLPLGHSNRYLPRIDPGEPARQMRKRASMQWTNFCGQLRCKTANTQQSMHQLARGHVKSVCRK